MHGLSNFLGRNEYVLTEFHPENETLSSHLETLGDDGKEISKCALQNYYVGLLLE